MLREQLSALVSRASTPPQTLVLTCPRQFIFGIHYSYPWARKHDRGEESGREARPTCVRLLVTGKDGRSKALFFPITSRSPGPSTRFVEIPETEARRAKLYTPAWVIVGEFTTDDLATSWATGVRNVPRK